MALLINPDGSVFPVEVEYDTDGRIQPKKKFDMFEDSEQNIQSHSIVKKKGQIIPTEYKKFTAETLLARVSSVVQNMKRNRKKKKSSIMEPNQNIQSTSLDDKKKLFQSEKEIDEYFARRLELHQVVYDNILKYGQKVLTKDLYKYLSLKYREHNEYCRSKGWGFIDSKAKNNKKVKNTMPRNIDRSTYEPCAISERNGNRHPVYGYARDRYGRVQERDYLDEDRRNEFKKLQRNQSNYDYSNYDSENDNDGYYDNIGYE